MKVLVTGAGGFLGGWVVESFLRAGVPVKAGIRSWNSALRLARYPAEMVACNVLSMDEVTAAIADCSHVVHCAMGSDDVSVRGTQNVLQAASDAHVERVVHVSSVAVYGKAPGVMTEAQARQSRGNRYAQSKIHAEEVCERFIAQGCPVVILRPSIIYGPFSDTWTVSFGKRLLSGCWGTLGHRGEGTCHLVYVTDVVQAIYRALTVPAAIGQTFNISGDEPITWNEYFVRFNAALGRPALQPIPVLPMLLRARLLSPVRDLARYALATFGPAVSKLHAKSSLAARYMNSTESSLKLTPTPEQLKLYAVQVDYVIDKARAQLDYSPRVSVSQGLQWSAQWLNDYGVLY